MLVLTLALLFAFHLIQDPSLWDDAAHIHSGFCPPQLDLFGNPLLGTPRPVLKGDST